MSTRAIFSTTARRFTSRTWGGVLHFSVNRLLVRNHSSSLMSLTSFMIPKTNVYFDGIAKQESRGPITSIFTFNIQGPKGVTISQPKSNLILHFADLFLAHIPIPFGVSYLFMIPSSSDPNLFFPVEKTANPSFHLTPSGQRPQNSRRKVLLSRVRYMLLHFF